MRMREHHADERAITDGGEAGDGRQLDLVVKRCFERTSDVDHQALARDLEFHAVAADLASAAMNANAHASVLACAARPSRR